MLVPDEDSHACQIILKHPGSSSVFLLLIRHLSPWLLVIPLRELWIISTAYESPGLSWQPQTNQGSWERYHSSAMQWRVGCGVAIVFFMDPTASRTRIPSLPSQAWAIWPCEKEVPLTLHRWGSCPHFPPSGSGRSSTNNSLMLQTCILWSPSSCLTWQHLQPLQHFMNEETAKLICFWFSCSCVIISKSFIVLVLRTDLAFNLYFFLKLYCLSFLFLSKRLKAMKVIPKVFWALQWHFQWEIGKDLGVNEDKESQWAVEALWLSVCLPTCQRGNVQIFLQLLTVYVCPKLLRSDAF